MYLWWKIILVRMLIRYDSTKEKSEHVSNTCTESIFTVVFNSIWYSFLFSFIIKSFSNISPAHPSSIAYTHTHINIKSICFWRIPKELQLKGISCAVFGCRIWYYSAKLVYYTKGFIIFVRNIRNTTSLCYG